MKRERWDHERLQRLRDLAVTLRYAHLIAVAMGATQSAVINMAGREGIDIIKQSPEQAAASKALARAREQRKYEKWKAKNKPAESQPSICVRPGTSKTSVVYRNQLPRIDDCMSKDRLRAMIAEACRNTAEMAL
jgi:stalled ribosome rescue protein Dom34